MTIHNLKRYKESLSILPDVEAMLKIFTLTELALTHYAHYLPAYKVLSTVKDQKRMLEMHHRELLEIKNSKGKRIEI